MGKRKQVEKAGGRGRPGKENWEGEQQLPFLGRPHDEAPEEKRVRGGKRPQMKKKDEGGLGGDIVNFKITQSKQPK